MKTSELMLGDYVSTPKGIFRVTAIQDNDVIFTDYADDITGAVDIEDVQPVPLTEEIIEKNGFEKQTDEFGKEYYDLAGPDFCLLNVDNIWWFGQMAYESVMHYRPDPIFAVNKVHKLQHALRMCDVEKEVVL